VRSTPRSLLSRQRRLSPLIALVTTLAVIALGVAGSASGQFVRAERPNVVVVMTDDQGPGMMKALPSVTRLIARPGATFKQAIATYPLCCPSRASFLTGQYAHNHGTLGNGPRSGGGYQALTEPRRTLASWLQASGYETAFIGKWLNGLRTPRVAPPGWTRWHGLVGAGGEGLSSFYDYDVFEPDGTPRHFGDTAADYQTDALTREYALPLIAEQSVTPGPFFLWLGYHPPHDGLGRDDAAGRRCSLGRPDARGGRQSAIPPPRYGRRFLATAVPHPPSFDERDLSDKPAFLRRRHPLDRLDREIIALNYRCGLAALLAVDDSIRAIVQALQATGQLDNTLLVFTTDQGAFAGQHRIRTGKNRPYEEALRVPLYMRGPGIDPGSVLSGPVGNIDVAPTILELTGAAMPPDLARVIDGVSLVPELTEAADAHDRVMLIEGRGNVARARRSFAVRSYVGVRTDRYAYVEHRRASSPTASAGVELEIGAGRTTDVELYDLDRDPYELRSAHRDPSYSGVRRILARLVDRLDRCAGAGCAVEEPVLAPRPLP
jgi:N-acetylglucosamine-6-sulfatase